MARKPKGLNSKWTLYTLFVTTGMIDTIHITYFFTSLQEAESTAVWMRDLLEKYKVSEDKSGNLSFSGSLRNLRVYGNTRMLSIQGSIPRFINGQNYDLLAVSQIKEFFMLLENIMSIPIEQARIYRLDMAYNLFLRYPPDPYYKFLGAAPRLFRLTQPRSLLYKNGRRQLAFYNKMAAPNPGPKPIPAHYLGKNVMRMEHRLVSKISEQLKIKGFKVGNLMDETIYPLFHSKTLTQYRNIRKLNEGSVNLSGIGKPKDFIGMLAVIGMEKIGGENAVLELVDELKGRGSFSNRQNYTRLRKMIKDLGNQSYPGESDLIQELNEKVNALQIIY